MRNIFYYLASAAGLLALIMLLVAGPLYRIDIIHFSTSFAIMRWAAYLGIAAMVLVIIAFFVARPGTTGRRATLAISFIAAFIAFYLPYSQLQTARSVPPIHDISTDTSNPPEFVEIAPLRADAPNPVEYAGEETAEQQREHYPEVQTLRFNQPPQQVFEAALEVVNRSGWELVDANANEGRIEATATTFWFGFKDDVVIRVVADGEQSLLDIRSKSRIGRSDVGANAARIRAFSKQLETTLAD
ncbi:DUF1499 domain-containing protein [Aliidiomarina minuta]|uniref:DUF1499 domain-containing protein n=1 Tax=Aliidiomarina minuta TaxID=880057 RepID=A0A432W1I3_9GAMM|nr:DUF1499 domain-containing protein [Aliidiomarina minuta]RUO23023.1 DUF1499 domain-containing protein [Aliidiomarina minuta]